MNQTDDELKLEQIGDVYDVPMMILRNMVIMPGTSVHFDIQREASIKAVNRALEQDEPLFVTMAKEKIEEGKITLEMLYPVGTLVKVKQVLKLPKGIIRVMLYGVKRAELFRFAFED